MIFLSKNGEKYQWIKIPRTGTTAYRKLFFPETQGSFLQAHNKFKVYYTCENCKNYDVCNKGFSLVRNPLTKFTSSLKYIIDRTENVQYNVEKEMFKICDVCHRFEKIEKEKYNSYNRGKDEIFKFWENEKIFYEFFYDNFKKNCQLTSGIAFGDIFNVVDDSFIKSFFITQVEWCYYPGVKIFKYENISEFNSWIETELGYDTKNITSINSSAHVSVPFNVTSDKFKNLVKHLFYDDFKYFGY